MLGSPAKKVKKRTNFTDLISKDLVGIILNKLPPISIISLKRAFFWDTKLSKIIGSIYDIVFSKIDLPKEIKNFIIYWLNNMKAVVSGSFVLKILNDDNNWKSGDIDIFVDKKYITYFISKSYKVSTRYFFNEQVHLNQNGTKIVYPKDDIFEVWNLSFNNISITFDFIFVNNTVEKHIKSFDLDICKSFISEKEIKIFNPTSIIKRTCEFDITKADYIRCLCEDRLDDNKNIIMKQCKKQVDRCEKYVNRQYTVNIKKNQDVYFKHPLNLFHIYYTYNFNGKCSENIIRFYYGLFGDYFERLTNKVGENNAKQIYAGDVGVFYTFWKLYIDKNGYTFKKNKD